MDVDGRGAGLSNRRRVKNKLLKAWKAVDVWQGGPAASVQLVPCFSESMHLPEHCGLNLLTAHDCHPKVFRTLLSATSMEAYVVCDFV